MSTQSNHSRKGSVDAKLSGGWTTYLASAHGVLAGSGMSQLTLEEMAGMTGMAFQFIMHKNCDVASVTVYDWVRRHQDALDRIGVLAEIHHYEPGTQTYEAARKRAVDRIKQAIDSGTGVIAWAIDTGEFGTIYGYDDEDGVFLVDGVDKFNRPLGSDPMLYQNIAKKFPPAPFLHYQIPLEAIPFDRDKAYLDSFAFYVQEMEKEYHMAPDFKSGFRAYGNWLDALSSHRCDPFGLRYCTTVYAESKCFAASYTRHLAQAWGGLQRLDEVADLFSQVAGLYQSMMAVLEQDWNGAQHLGKPVSAEQMKQLIPLVQAAMQVEERAVKMIKEALLKAA